MADTLPPRTQRLLKELSGLPPEDRLARALERLDHTERATHEVICLTEQRRAFINNFWGLDWKQNRAFETLAVTVLYAEVVHVCRLWDPPDPEGYSIPTLAASVDTEVFTLIASQIDPTRRDRDMERLRRASEQVQEIRKADELERLRNYRHKIAHAIRRTDQEARGEHVDQSTIKDTDLIVGRTVALMTEVSSVARQSDYDHTSDQQAEREVAERFFSALAPAVRAIVPARMAVKVPQLD